ncbi:MAG TPA: dNTP triphosphohydrolase [Mycobacterium sp.]
MFTPDKRLKAEHDCDRILYSDELRRLGGVTQVVAVGETPLFHTRLTHTLKVQQLARRLAEHFQRDESQSQKLKQIGGVNVSAAEAAGLAHDLGHPPFGHVGEAELNECCEAHGLDGFEGNAQTFRIMTKLAVHPAEPRGKGLGISPDTLRAVIKYPFQRFGPHEGSPKWNAYPSETTDFLEARKGLSDNERSLEAEIMDWADDVTYAVHDLEDFIRARHVPIGALIENSAEREAFIDASWQRAAGKIEGADRDEVVANFTSMLTMCFGGVYTQRDWQHSLELMDGCRLLIHQYISGATLGERPNPLLVPPNLRAEVGLFKQLTWYYVIFDPRLASLQLGQKEIVHNLFDTLHKWLKQADEDQRLVRVPRRLAWALELTQIEEGSESYHTSDARYARAVADYIASLTESQAIDLYHRIASPTGQSVLDPWMVY